MVDAGPVEIDAGPSGPMVPELYPDDRTLSPITPYVAASLRAIGERGPELRGDVFAKVGTAGTVSSNFLHCLDDGYTDPMPGQEPGAIDLDGRIELQDTIAHFRDGDAGGSNPYRRASLAAVVGMEAADVLAPDTDDSTLLGREIEAIQPRFAIVALGENDVAAGDFDSFGSSLLDLADGVIATGIIPVFTAMAPRTDDPALSVEVEHYNAIIRGVAQARQVPFVDLYRDLVSLPEQGLGEDGVLLSAYRPDGQPAPCSFTEAGLGHGYNLRNLRTLETLDRLRRTVLDGAEAPDSSMYTLRGTGRAADPYVIDGLPFTHVADTVDGTRGVDVYPGCQANQDESGPELTYRLDLSQTTRVRAVVVDRGATDIDLHIMAGSPDGDACVERAHRIISAELSPGTYFFNLDTFVGQNGELSGEYLFSVTEESL